MFLGTKEVSRAFKESIKCVFKKISMTSFMGVLRLFQGRLRVFQESFTGDSTELQGI